MSLQNNNIIVAKSSLLATHKLPTIFPILFSGVILATPVYAAEPLVDAVKNTTNCMQVRDPDARLACFDAASNRLVDILRATNTVESILVPETPRLDVSNVNAPAKKIGNERATAANDELAAGRAQEALADARTQEVLAVANADEETEVATTNDDSTAQISEDDLPTWAAGPKYTEEERAKDSSSFQATIVRITRNSRGRHSFYTEDGAVWQQTQNVKFTPPRSLPAIADFRQRLTGSPTITFDVSSRSYRVIRIK